MMLEGNSLKRDFMKFIIPSIVAQWVFALYTMVDGIFVARVGIERFGSCVGGTPVESFNAKIKDIRTQFRGVKDRAGIETEKARLAIAERIEKIQLPEGCSLVWQGEKSGYNKDSYDN